MHRSSGRSPLVASRIALGEEFSQNKRVKEDSPGIARAARFAA
jgi:hypothetical protein